MKALDRKAVRDVIAMRGQMLAIALVLASGVATFVLGLTALRSLERTLDTYYERHRFAQVFGHLKRAPLALRDRIAAIPGVAAVETRVVELVTLDLPAFPEPAVGRLVSLPDRGAPALNVPYLRQGRMPERGHDREVLVSQRFAESHGFLPGSTIRAVLNGRLETLRVAGIALSPEFVYQIRPGEMLPDQRRYGVFWMPARELEAAFDMDGAFNDVTLSLMPGAQEAEVIRQLDVLLDPWGGTGAYGRADQLSHKFVMSELDGLRGSSTAVPALFLGVAAFLLNVVLTRLVATQREQIAALKALGYGHRAIAAHYLKIVMLVVIAGSSLGTALGAWMGSGLFRMYARFFDFPVLDFHLEPSIVVLAILVSAIAAIVGTLGAVLRAVRLPPAEAMRPQAPPEFHPTIIERSGLQHLLSPAVRMILRQLERRPMKSAMSALGIALAVAVLVLGNFMIDAIDFAMDYEFASVQRYDVAVGFVEPTESEALSDLRHLPGVRWCEPVRAVPVRFRAGHRSRLGTVTGVTPAGSLFRLSSMNGAAVAIPPDGVVLSTTLADRLRVAVGDALRLEVQELARPVRQVRVAGLVDDFSGLSAYMSIDAVNRLMREDRHVMNVAYVSAEAADADALYHELKEAPRVATVTLKEAAIESFESTVAENLLTMRAFNVLFAVIIAVGVVYNGARVSLSERSRELATLRVIGFTRAEISMIQLGELAVLTLIAIPAGLAIGYGLAGLTTIAYDTELFRIPLVVDDATYGLAAGVVLVATAASGLVVRRLLDRLDLVAVLKSRE